MEIIGLEVTPTKVWEKGEGCNRGIDNFSHVLTGLRGIKLLKADCLLFRVGFVCLEESAESGRRGSKKGLPGV